jgi:hypothetical protein
MSNNLFKYFFLYVSAVLLTLVLSSCKNKKKLNKDKEEIIVETIDSLDNRCRLDFKTAKTLSKRMMDNEFEFVWVNAKANVTTFIDEKEENFDIRVSVKRDSAILVTIQYLLGIQVAKILVTKDSVTLVNYIDKTYFVGDVNYINEFLNADIDYELLQAVLFGNSAEFLDEEAKLKPVADRTNCRYLLSTQRKRRLRKIQTGSTETKDALQILTLKPDNYKIITNEFVEPATSRRFIANYSQFTQKDSVYAPYHVDIDILAEKKANIKIDYVRIEKNKPQRLFLSIPAKYDLIQLKK